MATHFLFPSHPLRPTEIDEMFADQRESLSAAGFTSSLVSDAVIQDGKPLRNIPSGAAVVYRGWMLNPTEYARLVQAIVSAAAVPLTLASAYLATHYLPNWYPLIAEFTPETRVFSLTAHFESELRALGWDAFFIKDYVKSLKTTRGAIIRDPSEIEAVIAEMKQFRGTIEGGLCVRRVESFLPDSERRYFVLHKSPFAPRGQRVPKLVEDIAERIPSPFFSVDIVHRADGALRIVEIGDGQVSDLVGWSAADFAAIWNES